MIYFHLGNSWALCSTGYLSHREKTAFKTGKEKEFTNLFKKRRQENKLRDILELWTL